MPLADDDHRVEVPETTCHLSQQEMRRLVECVNPLLHSSNFGIDLYIMARDVVRSFSN